MLSNQNAYYVFNEFVNGKSLTINVSDINCFNWQDYYDGLVNLMKDGIEQEFVHKNFIKVNFGNNNIIELSVFDLFFNMIFWYLIVRSNQQIEPEHLFFPDAITQNDIKDFIDNNFIMKVRTTMSAKEINNIIDDTLHFFADIDQFSFYLSNTINLKDTIDLMNCSKEFNDIMHTSLKNIPIEDVKNEGMKLARESIDIIVNDSEKLLGHDHCLRNSFISKEGINPRQYKEFAVHIGSKPNGNGGVHPAIIDTSYINGGLTNLVYQFIDSSSSRVAQIQMKNNVGNSGNFARILGINNIDSNIYDDPEYDCHTNNFVKVEIKSKKILDLLLDRYYRLDPDGIDYLIDKNSTYLIGRTIYLRSPETCASAARGHGVCFKCYGKLAYINKNINPGKYAAEKVSSQLTQRQLSAKHLLETVIEKIEWIGPFDKYFATDINIIQINPETDIQKNTIMIINKNNIVSDNDDALEEDFEGKYDRYITEFYIKDKIGNTELIKTADDSELYFSDEFSAYLNKYGISDGDNIILDLETLSNNEIPMFLISINNNELSKTLKEIQNLINKKDITNQYDRDSITQKLFELVLEGGLDIMGVHLEMLIMNQLRDINNILKKPDWSIPNEPYQLLTLDQALKDNPSIIISMLYKDLSTALYYPLSFKKHTSSKMDLFFMKQPQNFLADTSNITKTVNTKERICPVIRVHKK